MGVIYKNGVAYGGGSGGAGGTDNYEDLIHKPTINGVTLVGDLDSEDDLGIDKIEPLTNVQMNTLLSALN